MQISALLKYFVLAWGVPVLMAFVVRVSTPDPKQERGSFLQQSFIPTCVGIAEQKGTKRSEYFELRVESPKGERFYYRSPNRVTIEALERKFPKGVEVDVLYAPGGEGHSLMELLAKDSDVTFVVLSYEEVMDEYASRRRVVYMVAMVWCLLANLLAYALWKVDISESQVASKALKVGRG
ncbi:hypothetical protein P3T73_04620 [Kiritimatiellota bacterium B12222]|nr:hypothetical protein P3T73_04620 [Kiritimatiellota bacterium B12222]